MVTSFEEVMEKFHSFQWLTHSDSLSPGGLDGFNPLIHFDKVTIVAHPFTKVKAKRKIKEDQILERVPASEPMTSEARG